MCRARRVASRRLPPCSPPAGPFDPAATHARSAPVRPSVAVPLMESRVVPSGSRTALYVERIQVRGATVPPALHIMPAAPHGVALSQKAHISH